MRIYKFPKWLQIFFPGAIWDFSSDKNTKTVYLTFDDGPVKGVTDWVLETLDKHDIKATFFCVGENIVKNQDIYNSIIEKGHIVGNHTYNHLNGWETKTSAYIENTLNCQKLTESILFRPPYGKLKLRQFIKLKKLGFKIIFWSVLTYDFDNELKNNKRNINILKKIYPGSIVVFHDSEKAFSQLKNSLPVIIKTLKNEGYDFRTIC